jgi:hypothetical protein
MTRRALIPTLFLAPLLAGLCPAGRTDPPTPQPLQAETLPVTRADGDLKLTFTALETIPPPPSVDPNDPDEASWTRVSFRFDWGGRPMKEWAVQKITVTDPDGKLYTPRRSSTWLGKGQGAVSFAGPVWPTAHPWKVRLELARTSPFQSYEFWNVYNPDEILTVRGLTVPAGGQVVMVGRVAEAQGAKVQLIGLAGGNTPMPDGLPVKYAGPTLHWRVERPKDVHVTFLRATDAAGNVIKPKGAAMGLGNGGERYARELLVPPGVSEIYVAFGVHKSRYFELTAVPTAE